MRSSISIISSVFVCIFFCVIAWALVCPAYADEQTVVSNAKRTEQVISRDTPDYGVKGNQQQEFIKTKGLEYVTTKKDPKTQGVGFIRLKPKLENDSIVGLQKIFDVEFMNDETSGHKTKKDPSSGPYVKFEKMEDPEKNNILIRKEITKNYKTELSMGYRMSPYSEIYLGRGFLVEPKDNYNVDSRDDGWRIKFKFNF